MTTTIIEALQTQTKEIQEYSKSIVVTQENIEGARDYVNRCKEVIKQGKEFYRKTIEGANALHKDLVAKRNAVIAPAEAAKQSIERAMSAFLTEQDRIKRAADAERQRLLLEEHKKESEGTAPVVEGANLSKLANLYMERGQLTNRLNELSAKGQSIYLVEKEIAKVDARVAELEMKGATTAPPSSPQSAPIVPPPATVEKTAGVIGKTKIEVEVVDIHLFLEWIGSKKINTDGITFKKKWLKDVATMFSDAPGLNKTETIKAETRGRL